MALSRFILTHTQRSPLKTHPYTSQLLHRFSSSAAASNHHHQKPETSVSDSTNKPKPLSPPRNRRRRSLWSPKHDHRNNNFPLSGIGNAITAAATTMNRLLETFSPWNLIRSSKEKDESYSIKYEMPGLNKDDVKITVSDGMLFIRAEHREEAEEGGSDDDEYWSAARYGYYNTSLMLPEDAKVEEITAEMKDGVLHVIIPKDENKKKHIKEVQVG